jgi:SIR2-like domain
VADAPYGLIADQLKAGMAVPFLGAGASLAGRPADPAWEGERSEFLPNGVELSLFLAKKAAFPSNDPRDREDLAKVSSFFVETGGRPPLRRQLRGVFNRELAPGAIHRTLAAIPVPLVFVVTNYDTLLEKALVDAGRPFDVVVYHTDRQDMKNAVLWWPHGANEPRALAPNELYIDLATTTVVFKMHGTVVPKAEQWDGYVITEEDYVEFVSRLISKTAIPPILSSHFLDRSFLFLGYSLRDWNLRVVLRNLNRQLEGRDEDQLASWAIQRSPSELEVELWSRRKVKLYDDTVDRFAEGLAAEFAK